MIDKTLKEIEKAHNDLTEQIGKIIEEHSAEMIIGFMFLDARKRRKIIKELEKEQRQKEKKERKKKQ